MDVQFLNPTSINTKLLGYKMKCSACQGGTIFEAGFTFHHVEKEKDGPHLKSRWFCSLKCLTEATEAEGTA